METRGRDHGKTVDKSTLDYEKRNNCNETAHARHEIFKQWDSNPSKVDRNPSLDPKVSLVFPVAPATVTLEGRIVTQGRVAKMNQRKKQFGGNKSSALSSREKKQRHTGAWPSTANKHPHHNN